MTLITFQPTRPLFQDHRGRFLHHCPRPSVVQASALHTSPPYRVLITAPISYAARLSPYLLSKDLRPIIAPTITTATLLDDRSRPLQDAILRLHEFQVLACLSRQSLSSVALHIAEICGNNIETASNALKASGIRIAALGSDALAANELLGRTADIVPLVPSPSGLVQFMRADDRLQGASILCPVPSFTGMHEPQVVPEFLKELQEAGFNVTAVPAYETRPVKRESLEIEVALLADVDAIIFASTGEALALDGLLTQAEKDALIMRAKQNDLIIAAHGPVTAAGVQRIFSVTPIVSDNYSSFEGVANIVSKELSKDNLLLPS